MRVIALVRGGAPEELIDTRDSAHEHQHISLTIKEVRMSDNKAIYSKAIKAGKSCYFVDVKEAKNGSKYLSVTESRFEGEEKKRTSIFIFGEETNQQFRQAVDEAVQAISP